jgi:Mrp family chromosome partitioning ATPase
MIDATRYMVPTNISFLQLIPAGQFGSNEYAILSSVAMECVLESLRLTDAEVIVVDAPTLSRHSGTLAIMRQADGVVIVVDKGRTTPQLLTQGLEYITEAGIDPTAIVMYAGDGKQQKKRWGRRQERVERSPSVPVGTDGAK